MKEVEEREEELVLSWRGRKGEVNGRELSNWGEGGRRVEGWHKGEENEVEGEEQEAWEGCWHREEQRRRQMTFEHTWAPARVRGTKDGAYTVSMKNSSNITAHFMN